MSIFIALDEMNFLNFYYKIRNDEKMAMIVETRQLINKAIAQE